jgi:hypothetical protein
VSDLRRLGKRGSYRLGRLGTPSAAPKSPPAPHYPTWVPHHRGPAGLWLLACLAAAALIAAGALAGWWFLPFVAGLAGGVASRYGGWRLRVALPAAVLVAAVGWGAAVGWLALRGLPEREVARVIAALAGLPAHSTVTIAVTLLVAAIQAAAGLWLGRALAPHPPRHPAG